MFERAIGAEVADHGADFGGADFQSDDDRRGIKHVSSWGVRVWAASEPRAEPRWLRASAAGILLVTARSSVAMALLDLLAQVEDVVPAAQLLLQIGQAESHFAPLPRRHDQHLRGRHVNASQVHQPGHRRLLEGHDQLQGGLDLRGADAPAGLQLAGVDAAKHRQRVGRLVERRGALARVQRQHDPTVRVQLIHGQLNAPVRTRPGDVDLRDRFAFGNANAQGVGQDAFDRDGLDQGDQFQVPLHAREIERQQVLLGLDSRPAAQLVHGDNAVGLHVDFLDGERFVFIDQPVERPFAGAIEQIQAKDGRKDGAQADRAPCASARRGPGWSAVSRPAPARVPAADSLVYV